MIRVIFRKFVRENNIIAFFPDMKDRHLIMSYMYIGQHGLADYDYCLGKTSIALKSEYKSLLNELISVGYTDLKIMLKFKR